MMTVHARASQRKDIFSVLLKKIRTATQQLFSSIDCFDVLEQSNECCDPHELRAMSCRAISGLKSAHESAAVGFLSAVAATRRSQIQALFPLMPPLSLPVLRLRSG